MNILQYHLKKRALTKGIAQAVNARLLSWPMSQSVAVVARDARHQHTYTLLVHKDKNWAIFVHGSDRVRLDIGCSRGELRPISGITYRNRRVIHINDVPNDHTLKMVDQLLVQLKR